MEKIEILEKKIRQAAEHIAHLKEENKKLHAELRFLEEENKRTRQLIQENEVLHDQKKNITHRVEKILKKMDSLKV